MKKLVVLFGLVLFMSTSFAQKNDKALLVKYSKEEISTIKKEKPEEYAFLKYCVDNAFYVAAISQEKIDANPSNFGQIVINDINNINFYELKVKLKENAYQAFLIEGTTKVLMVKSRQQISKELKKIKN